MQCETIRSAARPRSRLRAIPPCLFAVVCVIRSSSRHYSRRARRAAPFSVTPRWPLVRASSEKRKRWSILCRRCQVGNQLNAQAESQWPVTWIRCARQHTHGIQSHGAGWRRALQQEFLVTFGGFVRDDDRRIAKPFLNGAIGNKTRTPSEWHVGDIPCKSPATVHQPQRRATSVPPNDCMPADSDGAVSRDLSTYVPGAILLPRLLVCLKPDECPERYADRRSPI